jgi:hypothetical protein
MPPKPPSRWTLLLIACLIVVAAFLPELVGASWHLVHGNSAHYRDWDIPVPTGWFAVNQGESLAVERMLRFALWQDAPMVVFLPVHVTSNYVFDRNVWEEEQVKIQVKKGYRLSSTRDIQVAGQAGYCWEFAQAADPARLWITCVLPAERLSADFSGDRSYAAAFYALLPGIVRHPRQA